jgi:hypothetical protein
VWSFKNYQPGQKSTKIMKLFKNLALYESVLHESFGLADAELTHSRN